MSSIPIHTLPTVTKEGLADALFHYTTAKGLIGILSTGTLWSTAYYCANDESELVAGKGVLEPLFRKHTYELTKERDSRLLTFASRGVDAMRNYAEQFERHISSAANAVLSTYITCFCKASEKEDYLHGLLSQWRGYGVDGGYALQFSRTKLAASIETAYKAAQHNYDLRDVHYELDNPLKDDLLRHSEAFVQSYSEHLSRLAQPLPVLLNSNSIPSPISGLSGGPLEALLNYLTHTKSSHFREERECRLSLVQTTATDVAGWQQVRYFERGGMPVPYVETPRATFDILSCIEWILIGPAPRIHSRLRAVRQLVGQFAPQIDVRPSHIPFTRL